MAIKKGLDVVSGFGECDDFGDAMEADRLLGSAKGGCCNRSPTDVG